MHFWKKKKRWNYKKEGRKGKRKKNKEERIKKREEEKKGRRTEYGWKERWKKKASIQLFVDYDYLRRKPPETATICDCLNLEAVATWFQNEYVIWVRDTVSSSDSVNWCSGGKDPLSHVLLLKKIKNKWSHSIGLWGKISSDFKTVQAWRLPPFPSETISSSSWS